MCSVNKCWIYELFQLELFSNGNNSYICIDVLQ